MKSEGLITLNHVMHRLEGNAKVVSVRVIISLAGIGTTMFSNSQITAKLAQ